MPIEPETKDWTWVIDRRCDECGFDGSAVAGEQVAELVRQNALAWRELLRRDPDELARRPTDDRWSSLEYACHVRDVFRLYDVRLHLMLDEDDPLYPNWDQDRSAVDERYNEQDPATVARDLQAAAATLAESFDEVEGDAWQRPGRRSDGARFTVETFARYLVHDPIHHVRDVEVNFALLAGEALE
jgi:DinB superfamily